MRRYPLLEKPERAALIAGLRQQLLARPEIDFAYLFGSFITDVAYHDIDIGVSLYSSDLSRAAAFDYAMDLSTALTIALGKAVDVHVLNNAPLGVQHTILQGVLLFTRDEERLTDLIERVASEVMDFAYHAEVYLREVLT